MKATAIDAAFRVHEGRQIEGLLAWGSGTGAGTMKNREKPFNLTRTYACAWTPYSRLDSEKNGEFRYLALASDPRIL